MYRRLFCFNTLVSFDIAAAGWLFFLANSVSAADVTLSWDPNSEADLASYGVYYQKAALGPPYLLFGYVTLAELSDPNNPSITVTGLDAASQYHFAVTALDTANNESGFSNSACAKIDSANVVTPCPASAGGGSDSSGGGSSSGGGGGGWFISVADGEHEYLAFYSVELSLWSLLVFLWRVQLRSSPERTALQEPCHVPD